MGDCNPDLVFLVLNVFVWLRNFTLLIKYQVCVCVCVVVVVGVVVLDLRVGVQIYTVVMEK